MQTDLHLHTPMKRHLVGLPVAASKDDQRRQKYYRPEMVLTPDTKVMLAPFGVREPKQVLKAAEVASQIPVAMLRSNSRIGKVVKWRMATYYAMRQAVQMSGVKAALVMNRDHSTLIHYERRRAADPGFLADKVQAILAVLV